MLWVFFTFVVVYNKWCSGSTLRVSTSLLHSFHTTEVQPTVLLICPCLLELVPLVKTAIFLRGLQHCGFLLELAISIIVRANLCWNGQIGRPALYPEQVGSRQEPSWARVCSCSYPKIGGSYPTGSLDLLFSRCRAKGATWSEDGSLGVATSRLHPPP